MNPLVETSIWLALKSRIETRPIPLPVAWPGETYSPPYSNGKLDPYLRVGRVSVAPDRLMIAPGQKHERTGRLIITFVAPLGHNISVYDQNAATIAYHFRDGVEMNYGGVCVSVTDYPHVQEGYEDNGYWTVPVSIPWRCFA